MRIHRKLIIAFIVPVLIIGSASLAGFIWNRVLFIESAEVSSQKIRIAKMINVVKNEMSRYVLKYIQVYDPVDRKNFEDAIVLQNEQLSMYDKLAKNSDESTYFMQVQEAAQRSASIEEEIFQIADKVAANTKDEQFLLFNKISAQFDVWHKYLSNNDQTTYEKNSVLYQLEIEIQMIISQTKYQAIDNTKQVKEQIKKNVETINQLYNRLNQLNLDNRETTQFELLRTNTDQLIAAIDSNMDLNDKINSLLVEDDKVTSQMDSILDDKLYVIADNRDKAIENIIILMNYVIVGALSLLVILSMFMAWVFSNRLLRPVEALKSAIARLRAGEDVAIKRISNDEIGDLSDAFGDLVKENKSHATELNEQGWLKEHVADILKMAQSESTLESMANVVIAKVSELLDAGCGAFYIAREDEQNVQTLYLLGTYGYKRRKGLSNQFKFGESLVGQCALESKIIILSEVPENYVHITSGLGEKQPSYIIVVPLTLENKTLGVVELALFHKVTEIQQQFLEQFSSNLAVVIEAIRNREQAELALKKVQEASEELQVQQEELRATNEELEEKTHILQKSEEELKSQSEEMQASNEELAEKINAIEQQKQEIQTKNKELETIRQELELKAEDLSRAGQYKTEFLANMSHELRTPLNSLLLLSSSFAKNEDGNLTPDQIEQANIIHKGGQDLLTLINDILDLSKVEAGKLNIQIEPAQVSEILADLKTQFETMIKAKGLEFIINNTSNVETIKTDAYRLKQVLRNLISNAFKFTKQGSIKLLVTPDERNKNNIMFKVEDTGIGIEKQKFKDIFEAFQQAYGDTDRKYGGTGLGLTISREIAKLLGGEILLESEVGKGSTFSVRIPIGLESAAANVVAPKVAVPSTPQPGPVEQVVPKTEDKVILLIGADKEFMQKLMQITKEKGYKCIAAANASAGLTFAEQLNPIGIIVDLADAENVKLINELNAHASTKDIPVHIISNNNANYQASDSKRITVFKKPTLDKDLDNVFDFFVKDATSSNLAILLVEDDKVTRDAVSKAAKAKNINIVAVDNGKDCLDKLRAGKFAGLILDLNLPDYDGINLLHDASKQGISLPPIIVYSQRDLNQTEFARLNEYTNKIVLKEGDTSLQRLLNECSLFLHAVNKNESNSTPNVSMITDADNILRDKEALLVDDDMRNVYALSMILKRQGMKVTVATNGEECLKKMDSMPKIDIVIMDVMMPVMDGYETTRRIRKKNQFSNLPIIAVTAKAMPDDRTACLDAGANDYITKPIDADKLLSMMRVWLSSSTPRKA